MAQERVLVVEDDEHVLGPLIKVLNQRGFEAHGAVDGEAGFELAQKVLPDALVLDIMMPKVDGVTLLKRLREIPRLALCPAIMLTALPVANPKVESLVLGGVDYLGKPFRFEHVVQGLQRALVRGASLKKLFSESGPTTEILDPPGLGALLDALVRQKRSTRLALAALDRSLRLTLWHGKIVSSDAATEQEVTTTLGALLSAGSITVSMEKTGRAAESSGLSVDPVACLVAAAQLAWPASPGPEA